MTPAMRMKVVELLSSSSICMISNKSSLIDVSELLSVGFTGFGVDFLLITILTFGLNLVVEWVMMLFPADPTLSPLRLVSITYAFVLIVVVEEEVLVNPAVAPFV